MEGGRDINLKEILRDSLYYPSSAADGGIIKFCNENFDEFGISSFVYADYGYGEDKLLWSIKGITGYRVVENVSLKPDNLLPKGPVFIPSSITKEEYLSQHNLWKKPFARFFELEREGYFSEWHGPSHFTLLYIGGRRSGNLFWALSFQRHYTKSYGHHPARCGLWWKLD